VKNDRMIIQMFNKKLQYVTEIWFTSLTRQINRCRGGWAEEHLENDGRIDTKLEGQTDDL